MRAPAADSDDLSPSPSRPLRNIFAAVILVTLLGLFVVYWMGLQVTASNRVVIRNQDVLREIVTLLTTLTDAETGQRGYLLTGEDVYLDPYAAAAARFNSVMIGLHNRAHAGELSQAQVDEIARLSQQKLAELRESIELRRAQGPAAALAVVKSDRGKQIMDELRNTVARMEARQRRELDAAERVRNLSTNLRTWVSAAMAGITLAFVLWAARKIQIEIDHAYRRRELLRVTLASIGDAVIVTNRKGGVIFLNDEAEKLTGWSAAEARGKPLPEVFHIINESTREVVESPVEKVLRLGQVVGLANHTLLIRRDGREVPIDDSGAPVREIDGSIRGVILVFRDFSEQRQAEMELQESESRFRTLADTLPQLAWMADEKGYIFWYNARWYEYTGKSAAEMEHHGWAWVQEPGIAKSVEERWRESIKQGAPLDMEFPLRSASGEFRWFLTRVVPLRDAKGRIVRWIGTHTDVHEKRQAESALRDAKISAENAKAAAEHANSAKDRFLAVLSHELRTPLTPVLLTAAALETDLSVPFEIREHMAMVRRNVELETKLIDDLLDLNRIVSGKLHLQMEPVSINDAVRDVCNIGRAQIEEKKIHLHCDFDENTGAVIGDAARLHQVFWNILLNATKFTPAEGNVHISSRSVDGHVRVQISDDGIGIEPELLQRIFDAFEQGEPTITGRFGGLGLGLAISKAIIELHHGSIRAESRGVNAGASFIIDLPVARSGTQLPSDASPSGPTQAAIQLRLLIVEDHPDTASMLARLLQSSGHVVTIANSATDALEIASRETFDLLLCDIGLPDMPGYEVMQRIRAIQPIRGIAMSGYGRDEDMQRSRMAGFSEHLVKPIRLDQLEEAITRLAQTLMQNKS